MVIITPLKDSELQWKWVWLMNGVCCKNMWRRSSAMEQNPFPPAQADTREEVMEKDVWPSNVHLRHQSNEGITSWIRAFISWISLLIASVPSASAFSRSIVIACISFLNWLNCASKSLLVASKFWSSVFICWFKFACMLLTSCHLAEVDGFPLHSWQNCSGGYFLEQAKSPWRQSACGTYKHPIEVME